MLRREAETLILPGLPAFLKRKYEPKNNDERLAFLGICQFEDLRAPKPTYSPRLSRLIPHWLTHCRRDSGAVPPAHAVVAGGGGGGADGSKLGETERARWRRQARAWLHADLEAWTKKLQNTSPADRAKLQQALARWRTDADLAGLRDSDALDKLPEAERQECRKLWTDLDALLKRSQAAK